jgi:hypothetical protein
MVGDQRFTDPYWVHLQGEMKGGVYSLVSYLPFCPFLLGKIYISFLVTELHYVIFEIF